MNRQEKASLVEALRKDFTQSEASFLVNYKGLTVDQMQSLRSKLREKGGSVKVAKARLMKRAVDGVSGVQDLAPHFKDQIALVFASEESPAVAKVLHDFSKLNESLELLMGYFESRVLDKNTVERIASLPSKEVLLAQLCGSLNAPLGNFSRTLNLLIIRLLFVLKQVGEKKQA